MADDTRTFSGVADAKISDEPKLSDPVFTNRPNSSRIAYVLAIGGALFMALGLVLVVGSQFSPKFRFAVMRLEDSILPLLLIGVGLVFLGWLLRPVYIR